MNEGNGKLIRGVTSSNDTNDNTKTFEIGEVVSNNDPKSLGRIKVRIKGSRARGGDDGIADEDLPWCFPLISKFINVQPNVKEAVFVFSFSKSQQFIDRMYIGPIISQPQKLSFDPFYMSALAGFSFGSEEAKVSVDTIPSLKGVFPNKNDISIQGRYNTEITQKKNEIILKAGKFVDSPVSAENPFPFSFNKKTQGYFQIKNDVTISGKDAPNKKGTVTNIVSNKINLLTHDGAPIFNLTNQDDLISEEELTNILENAHQLVFGDVLLEYLKLLKEALFSHVHNGSGNPATDLTASGNKQALGIFKAKANELEKQMLSKNIRIN